MAVGYMTPDHDEHEHVRHNVVHGNASINFQRRIVMSFKFLKDKETKTKVRYAATVRTAQKGISGSLYIDKDSELAKNQEHLQ